MNYYLSPRAQDEICEQLIKDFAGLYYSYQPVDIAGFARSIGLTLRYVSFINEEDETTRGRYIRKLQQRVQGHSRSTRRSCGG